MEMSWKFHGKSHGNSLDISWRSHENMVLCSCRATPFSANLNLCLEQCDVLREEVLASCISTRRRPVLFFGPQRVAICSFALRDLLAKNPPSELKLKIRSISEQCGRLMKFISKSLPNHKKSSSNP